MGVNRLKGMINRCVKLLCGGVVEGDNAYNILNLLNFDQIYKYFLLIKTFKYYKLNMSGHFKSHYNNLIVNHSIQTRFNLNGNFNLPNMRISKYNQSFLVNSIKKWNSIPFIVKNTFNIYKFKRSIRSIV